MVTSRQQRTAAYGTIFKAAVYKLQPFHHGEFGWAAQYNYDKKRELYVLRRSPTNGALGAAYGGSSPYQQVAVAYHIASDQWFVIDHPAVNIPPLPKVYEVNGERKRLDATGLTKSQMHTLVAFGLAELAKSRVVREGYTKPRIQKRKPRVNIF